MAAGTVNGTPELVAIHRDRCGFGAAGFAPAGRPSSASPSAGSVWRRSGRGCSVIRHIPQVSKTHSCSCSADSDFSSGLAVSTTGGGISGSRTWVADDHSAHGAYTWRDYFKVNTDHKVIGIQYLCTTFIFFMIGGALAEGVRAEIATPGEQYFSPSTYNGLFSVHAALMIFLFIIPAFAGLANFVIPLMLGAQDMAFPRLNALSFWMLPVAGAYCARRSWSAPSTPDGPTTRRSRCTAPQARPSG